LHDTPLSLLERLRLRPDAASWARLVDLYGPFIRGWLHRQGVQDADLDDLAQDVMAVVVREMPSFRHDLRQGAFRRWLRTIATNRLRSHRRASQPHRVGVGEAGAVTALATVEDPDDELARRWDEEHDRHVIRRLLELIEPDFEPPTWSAFRLLVLEERPTREVAERLGLSPNAVRIARSRVLARLRKEAEGLID
jgi:RNA polymerase sigma-70 factor (ECF subfamily)